MTDSSDSDTVDARSNAVENQRRNNGNVGENPQNLAGPSGLAPTRRMRKRVGRKKRKEKPDEHKPLRMNCRPENYQLSEWFIEEMPQKRYFPQIGDEVVYFRQGHEIYLSAVRLKYPRYYVPQHPVPWSSFNLSAREYCRVTKVEFVLHPSRMCKLRLRLTRYQQLSNERFTMYYHPVAEAPDFLVLKDVYNAGSLEHWRVGQRFRCAMPNKTWRRGMITAIGPLDRRFPESRFLRYRVRWDDGSVGRLSPWDLVSNNHETLVSPRDARITLRHEELNAWRGVSSRRDWPLGDRELFLDAIAPKLEQLLELLICEPFVDARHERANPVYLATVAYPVDIGLILLRLDSGFYRRISSLRFDIAYMLSNALHFYPARHSLTKIARLSTELLTRIIRDCSRNVPLKVIYRQSLDAVCYSETESEEDRRRAARRKKKLRRLKKSHVPSKQENANNQVAANDENRAPCMLREISNRETAQRSPLRLRQPANSEVCLQLSRGQQAHKIRVIEVSLKDDMRELQAGEEKQLASRHLQNAPSRGKCRLRDRPSRFFLPPVIIEFNQSRAQLRPSRRKYARQRIVLEEPKSKAAQQPLEYACMTLTQSQDSNLVKPDSSTPDICAHCGSLVSQCQHRKPTSEPGPSGEQNATSTSRHQEPEPGPSGKQNATSTRRHQEPEPGPSGERNATSTSRHQEPEPGPEPGPSGEQNATSTSRHQEPEPEPEPGPSGERNATSTSRHQESEPGPSGERNATSTSRHQEPEPGPSGERNATSTSQRASDLELTEHSQPSTSRARTLNRWRKGRSKRNLLQRSRASADRRRQQARANVDRVPAARKFPIKRPKESSSSASTTTSSSDSDMPAAFSSFRAMAKRARIQKISKMKEWRVNCLLALQTLWEDEDAAMFRESAMENHRRSVIEWVSLEYIMDNLKSGAYKDPNAVVDEVHTMLLHARSLISAGKQEVAIIIDNLSLLFDGLISPVLQKWDDFTDEVDEVDEEKDKVDEEEDEVEYNYMGNIEPDVGPTSDDVSSSSNWPDSTPPQSPS